MKHYICVMARKKWSAKEDPTPEILRGREKNKWQIALRRYVIESQPSMTYAHYFGLEITKMREWFEIQFKEGLSWSNFGEKWQFGHVIPVHYFDLEKEEQLSLCWNFINLKVEPALPARQKGQNPDLIAAKSYFSALFEHSRYQPCLLMVEMLAEREQEALKKSGNQLFFLGREKEYLQKTSGFSGYEFDLLNKGSEWEEVLKEQAALKKIHI